MSIAGGGLPHLSPDGPRYFGGTFLPFNALRPPRTTLRGPTTAMDSESIPTCCGIQLGSSSPIRVWILDRCNTRLADTADKHPSPAFCVSYFILRREFQMS